MTSAINRNSNKQAATRRYVGEGEVSVITGFSPRTLQKDRLLNRNRFPYYKVGKKVLYDLGEVEAIVREGRQDAGLRPAA